MREFQYICFAVLLSTLACVQTAFGQPRTAFSDIRIKSISQERLTPNLITFSDNSPVEARLSTAAIRELFELGPDEALTLADEIKYPHGDIIIRKYKLSYRGVPVEHATYNVLVESGSIRSIHAEDYILSDVRSAPVLSQEQALQSALEAVPSELYAWEATQRLLSMHTDLTASQRQALERARRDEFPVGQLVYVQDFSEREYIVDLAYRFEIESVEPLFRDRVYVSAQDGHLMLRDPLIKHGTGDTRYAGTRTFPTTKINTTGPDTFELRGIEPISNVYCETRNVNGFGGLPISVSAVYALSTPIRDGDQGDPCLTDGAWTVAETGNDIWSKNEHWRARFGLAPFPAISCCLTYTPFPGNCNEIQNDDIALDAQWGASVVARYWHSRHGRNSFDDEGSDILSYVHYGDAYNNAFWNGSFMTYGDGTAQKPLPDPVNGDFGPFTSLDICAHEIGHAICSHTSDLVYQKESGAMNEGLSDIWAAAIERFALDSIDGTLPYDPFGIGEQIDDRDNGLPPGQPGAYAIRWMDDPHAAQNPDTYNGTSYYPTEGPLCLVSNLATDYCGVHINSSVLNKWFYFLVMGSGQPFSPGTGLSGSKAAQDDGINDFGNSYNVTGLGFVPAEMITYLAESLLTPNAKFSDMRAASIEAARALFGVCAFEEEQVTNAWYAVGVGDSFQICTPRIEFGAFNPSSTLESADQPGCDASRTYAFVLHSYMANQTIHFVTSGNATEHDDYDLEEHAITFNGNETKILHVIVYDDKVIEPDPDTILLMFNDAGFADTAMFIILDDDVAPMVGDSVTLLSENFTTSALPSGWQQVAVNVESGNDWQFNGTGLAAGKAFVGIPGSTLPAYNLTAFTNVRLVSPLLDARGRSDVSIAFDWQAGGEADLIEPTLVFDYGTFQISYDGQEWVDIQNFVGAAGGLVIASGSYEQMHPELDNRAFYLGFRWYNDGLLGSAFSITIDNVVVTAQDIHIASTPGDFMQSTVPAGEFIAFVGDTSNELIGTLDASSADLGCMQLSIAENDPDNVILPAYCDYRSSKVFELSGEDQSDSVTMTLYYKTNEVTGWLDPAVLNILAVAGNSIDGGGDSIHIFINDLIIVDDHLQDMGNYISYTFRTTPEYKYYALTEREPYPVTRLVRNTSDNDLSSLRERIAAACPSDTIRFHPLLEGQVVQLTGPEIQIDKHLAIIGLGMDLTAISGENTGRIFHILPGNAVYLQDMTLCCGEDVTGGDAILNEGAITVRDVHVKEE